MLSCIFGHKIVNNRCIKCGKTVCEINGHEWIYTETGTFAGKTRPRNRICNICKIEEQCIVIKNSNYYGEQPVWIRIK